MATALSRSNCGRYEKVFSGWLRCSLPACRVMLKLHNKIARALDEGLASLEFDEGPNEPPRRRRSQLYKEKSLKKMSVVGRGDHFTKLDSKAMIEIQPIRTTSSATIASDADGLGSDGKHEKGGFDGIDCAFNTVRRSSSAVE